jgi:hypothetical protein
METNPNSVETQITSIQQFVKDYAENHGRLTSLVESAMKMFGTNSPRKASHLNSLVSSYHQLGSSTKKYVLVLRGSLKLVQVCFACETILSSLSLIS